MRCRASSPARRSSPIRARPSARSASSRSFAAACCAAGSDPRSRPVRWRSSPRQTTPTPRSRSRDRRPASSPRPGRAARRWSRPPAAAGGSGTTARPRRPTGWRAISPTGPAHAASSDATIGRRDASYRHRITGDNPDAADESTDPQRPRSRPRRRRRRPGRVLRGRSDDRPPGLGAGRLPDRRRRHPDLPRLLADHAPGRPHPAVPVSWPTLLLALQLGVGLYAAFELARGLRRGRRPGPHLLGPALLALLLVPLALDGLWLQADLAGRLAYELDLEPSLIRPAQLGL